jgi:hypothetical protein
MKGVRAFLRTGRAYKPQRRQRKNRTDATGADLKPHSGKVLFSSDAWRSSREIRDLPGLADLLILIGTPGRMNNPILPVRRVDP